jgi:hypothetical protein
VVVVVVVVGVVVEVVGVEVVAGAGVEVEVAVVAGVVEDTTVDGVDGVEEEGGGRGEKVSVWVLGEEEEIFSMRLSMLTEKDLSSMVNRSRSDVTFC